MGRQVSKHKHMEPVAAVHTGSTSAAGISPTGRRVALGPEGPAETVVLGKEHTDEMPTLGQLRNNPLDRGKAHEKAEPLEAFRAGSLSDAELQELWDLLFGLVPDEDDVLRWMQSGFVFVGDRGTNVEGESLPCPWGLRQDFGGPCGVLAAVQAFIVRELLWGGSELGTFPRTPSAASTVSTEFGNDLDSDSGASASILSTPRAQIPAPVGACPPEATQEAGRGGGSGASDSCEQHLVERFAQAGQGALLACTLARMLHMAAPVSKYIWAEVHTRSEVRTHEFKSAISLQRWLASKDGIGVLPCPVLSLVCSLALTRGLSVVRSDMDDASVPLVGLFGHCSQELTNLCLTGCATTNVFDGDVTFEEGEDALKLRGISRRPEVGFFSALEPLRFCEVGRLFKQPKYPLWVVGSATHYTLLFSGDCSASHSRLAAPPLDATSTAATDAEAPCPCCGGNTSEEVSDGATSLRLLHFNGRDFGAEQPTLVPVEVQVPCRRRGGEQTPLGTLLTSDQDERIFAEVLRCRWPEAEVSYPGFGNNPNEARQPPRLS